MEYLMIKVSNGTMMVQNKKDQDYSDAEATASSLTDEHHNGETYKWAIVDRDAIEAHASANSKNTDDYEIDQKQNVPGPNTMLFRTGESAGDLSDTDNVVHCAP